MKLYLTGNGKMGKMVAQIAQMRGHEIVSFISESDACIDFSHADAVLNHVKEACEHKRPIIIGTTGWESDLTRAQDVVREYGNAALFAPNFSIGVALFRKLLKQADLLFGEYEKAGIEYHHSEKKDAPSGTAKAIQDDLNLKTPFSSVRCGAIIGTHSLLFDSPVETITLTHAAKNREGFALGAVRAAEWIVGKKGWFTLDDMLHSANHSV